MKVAVLVCGMYRELDIAIKSWSFRNYMDCDFYVSTWDTTRMINEKYKIYYNKKVTEDLIELYLPNAKISILNEKHFMDNFYLNTSNNPISYDKIVYHWKNALSMMLNSNIEYDLIIINRFDNFFNDANINIQYEDDSLYIPNFDHPGFINTENKKHLVDVLFVGKFKTIKSFISNLPDYFLDIHSELVDKINELKLNVKDLNSLKISLVRPNVRCINNIDHVFGVINYLDDNWRKNWPDKHKLENPLYWKGDNKPYDLKDIESISNFRPKKKIL